MTTNQAKEKIQATLNRNKKRLENKYKNAVEVEQKATKRRRELSMQLDEVIKALDALDES